MFKPYASISKIIFVLLFLPLLGACITNNPRPAVMEGRTPTADGVLTADNDDEKDESILTDFDARVKFQNPDGILETIDRYVERYGYPVTTDFDSGSAQLVYQVRGKQPYFHVYLLFREGKCTEARVRIY